jgi:DNA gyrase subunit B
MVEYDAGSIVVMTALQALRRRPAMYVGDVTDGTAQHQLLWEVLGHAIEEHLIGSATRLQVHLEGDAITVEDDGRGIPVDVSPRPHDEGRTLFDLRFTKLWHAPAAAPKLYGMGLPPVTALSTRLEVKVWRDGRTYRADFERGELVGALRDEGPTTRTGTRLRFSPDFTVLTRRPWDVELIRRRLRAVAALNPGLAVGFQGETFEAPEGLADHVRHLARGLGRLHAEPIRVQGTAADVDVEVALLWTERPETEVAAFVNQSPTAGGTHLEGLWAGLGRAFAALAPERLGSVGVSPLREVMSPGLIAAVSVGLSKPCFSLGHEALTSAEVSSAVADVLAGPLAASLVAEPALLRQLLRRVPGAAQPRPNAPGA